MLLMKVDSDVTIPGSHSSGESGEEEGGRDVRLFQRNPPPLLAVSR